MTKEEFNLSRNSFCLWNSLQPQREVSYEATKQLLNQLPVNCPANDDYLNYILKLEIPKDFKAQLSRYYETKDNIKSLSYTLSNLNEHFQNLILLISKELRITQKHTGVCLACKTALFYFSWLQKQNITNCSEINHENTRAFLSYASKTMNKSNGFMNTTIRQMRKIFKILDNYGFHNVPDTLLGYKAAKKRNIILPAFTNEEILKILKVPNTSTFERDYGILQFSHLYL